MTMPAGKYFLGDLCYVMHPEWDECCELFFEGRTDHGCNQGEFTLKDGRRFANFNTAYGDGCYPSNIGTDHAVDSGSIGCILVSDIRDDTYANLEELGAVVTFDAPFRVSNRDGQLRFGPVVIETRDLVEVDY